MIRRGLHKEDPRIRATRLWLTHTYAILQKDKRFARKEACKNMETSVDRVENAKNTQIIQVAAIQCAIERIRSSSKEPDLSHERVEPCWNGFLLQRKMISLIVYVK